MNEIFNIQNIDHVWKFSNFSETHDLMIYWREQEHIFFVRSDSYKIYDGRDTQPEFKLEEAVLEFKKVTDKDLK